MRISDWSSDVCSSDLAEALVVAGGEDGAALGHGLVEVGEGEEVVVGRPLSVVERSEALVVVLVRPGGHVAEPLGLVVGGRLVAPAGRRGGEAGPDRKSTRLNSSH